MAADEARVGRIVDGKYRLDRIVRRDRWSITYRAEHTGIQRFVELKTVPERIPAEGPDAARLLREARAAGSVAHRNVQSVVDSGTDDEGRPFVVYEALEGRTVAELLADHPEGLETQRAARIALQMLEGLDAVHRGGVVHRAFGPDNVRVVEVRGGGELAKLTGFHEAVFLAEAALSLPPSDLPPAPYVAPEARRPGAVAPSLDVYSAGVLLRALLTGSPAPGGPMSDTARRAVERATATTPEERFPRAELLMHAVALLAPTSQRPPREELSTPADPLLADLHYLKLRRTTREAERPPARGEATLQLLPVLLSIEAVYKKLGSDGWDRLVQRVPEVEDLLPGAGRTSTNVERGVPVELLARVLATADELGGRGDLGLAAEVGELIARRGIHRLVPSLPRPVTPERIVDRFSDLWSAVSRQGDVVMLERGPGTARIAVRGQVEPSLELCALVAGLLRGTLREGGDGTEVYTTACQALGDVACVVGVSWKR